MKRKTNFTHLSTRSAKQVAIEDMKKDKVDHSILYNQSKILSQPILAHRLGLFGL